MTDSEMSLGFEPKAPVRIPTQSLLATADILSDFYIDVRKHLCPTFVILSLFHLIRDEHLSVLVKYRPPLSFELLR